VLYASGLDSPDPRCVVSILGCTGDWTGGWDCTEPGGADRYITSDGRSGRLVEVIERGEPACLVSHWTGIYFNGQQTGFKIFQEVVRRLHARFDNLAWMKLAEIARYWAARELTRLDQNPQGLALQAPFACPAFTVRLTGAAGVPPVFHAGGRAMPLKEVSDNRRLEPQTWVRDGDAWLCCFDLPKGSSRLEFNS
jgi:hypothetical protein